MLKLPRNTELELFSLVNILEAELTTNLFSCAAYGSAVRGGFEEGRSDINLLIVLNESLPESHKQISASIAESSLPIEPFVLGTPGIERSFNAFAIKFISMKRDYHVLTGQDPLKEFQIDEPTERFLCEQQLRNARLRLVHGYIVHGRNRARYAEFIDSWVATIFTDVREALTLLGVEQPDDFEDSIPFFEERFGCNPEFLRGFLKHKTQRHSFWSLTQPKIDPDTTHSQLFALLVAVLHECEQAWPSAKNEGLPKYS